MDQKLVFRISKDGMKVSVEGKGFTGPDCLEKAKLFMEKLGSVDSQELKPSFNEIPWTEPVQYNEEAS